MLLYHPAFDIHHCMFRVLTLLESLTARPFEKQRILILDFYLIFPYELSSAQFPAEFRSTRTQLRKLHNTYEDVSDPKRLFQRIQPYQESALECLASYNLIAPELLRDRDEVSRTTTPIPEELGRSIAEAKAVRKTEIEVLKLVFQDLQLTGPKGLKKRTDLLESRYDLPPSIPIS